jgi:chromosome segregation ATPase
MSKTSEAHDIVRQLSLCLQAVDSAVVTQRRQQDEEHKQQCQQLQREIDQLRLRREGIASAGQFPLAPVQLLDGRLPQGLQGLIQIKEYKYNNKSWFTVTKIVHFYLTKTLNYSPQTDDIVESNENYFQKLTSMEHEMKQESQRLNQLLETAKHDKSTVEATVSQMQVNIQQMEVSFRQKEIVFVGRLNENQKELETLKRENTGYLETIQRMETEKRDISNARDHTQRELATLRSVLQDREAKIQKLQKESENVQQRIIEGVAEFEKKKAQEIQATREKHTSEIQELKRKHERNQQQTAEETRVEIDRLMGIGMQQMQPLQDDRAKAIEQLDTYQSIVRDILSGPGVPRGLLASIEERLRASRNVT